MSTTLTHFDFECGEAVLSKEIADLSKKLARDTMRPADSDSHINRAEMQAKVEALSRVLYTLERAWVLDFGPRS